MSHGYIKMHRKILDWEWYSDANVFRVFFHCLVRANYADTEWRGHSIKRGQFVTSLDTLALETGYTTSQVRTALDKLKKTGEIASLAQARSRIITVIKYNDYQGDSSLIEMRSQSNRDEIATDKKLRSKEVKNKDIKTKPLAQPLNFDLLRFSDSQLEEFKNHRKAKRAKITQRVINTLACEFDKARAKGFTTDDILNSITTRGWTGFEAGWMKENQTVEQKNNAISSRDIPIEQQLNDRSWAQ